MATFKAQKPTVNLNSKKGGHGHLVVELDGTAVFKEGAKGDTVKSVEDTANGVSFVVINPTPKGNRMKMKIRNKAVVRAKDRDLTGGTLTITLTANGTPVCQMVPVNYITEEDPCAP